MLSQMPSFLLILIWVSFLFFPTGFARSNSVRDLDPTDDQPLDSSSLQEMTPSGGTEASNFESSPLLADTVAPGLEDTSFFTDTDLLDPNDPALSSGILDASCSNDDGIQPSKLRARGAACANPNQPLSIQAPDLSKISTSRLVDAVGALNLEGSLCFDPEFALYHIIPVCDQFHTGVPRVTGWTHALYPSSLSKFTQARSSHLLSSSIHPKFFKSREKNNGLS